MNEVISQNKAIVDGKTTGLAGCTAHCPRPCLRKDPLLITGVLMTPTAPPIFCAYFIKN